MVSRRTSRSPDEWKDFLIRHKWMPASILVSKFGIRKYDLDNFRRKAKVRAILDSWRISLSQPADQLRRIFEQAWQYYLVEVESINFGAPPRDWVPKLIAIKNVSRGGTGFGFLTTSKYFEIICPRVLAEFRAKGFTNVALAAYEFWPGKSFLLRHGVLPYMFHQTHRAALVHVDVESMLEHIYLNFLADDGTVNSDDELVAAKERFLARHDESGFITTDMMERFGVPYNFYKDTGGLRAAMKKIAAKYAAELGYVDGAETRWSSGEFRKRFPERVLNTCEYCGLRPVTLHHLLPRQDYPTLLYENNNVVALWVQVHDYISRNYLASSEREQYSKAIRAWLREKEGPQRRAVFRQVMGSLHATIYGYKMERPE